MRRVGKNRDGEREVPSSFRYVDRGASSSLWRMEMIDRTARAKAGTDTEEVLRSWLGSSVVNSSRLDSESDSEDRSLAGDEGRDLELSWVGREGSSVRCLS